MKNLSIMQLKVEKKKARLAKKRKLQKSIRNAEFRKYERETNKKYESISDFLHYVMDHQVVESLKRLQELFCEEDQKILEDYLEFMKLGENFGEYQLIKTIFWIVNDYNYEGLDILKEQVKNVLIDFGRFDFELNSLYSKVLACFEYENPITSLLCFLSECMAKRDRIEALKGGISEKTLSFIRAQKREYWKRKRDLQQRLEAQEEEEFYFPEAQLLLNEESTQMQSQEDNNPDVFSFYNDESIEYQTEDRDDYVLKEFR